MKKIYLVLFLLVQYNCFGQGENNKWYFGYSCGLDFNTGVPVMLLNGQLSQWEGVASISDNSGTLLFYTDGITVWNSNHITMLNGNGLLGNYSSTHSATIVRDPGSTIIYYIFTCPELGSFNYSTVDMTMNGGLGDVAIKNSPLHAQSSEKCCAIYKPGSTNVWVVGHSTDTIFYAYQVTPAAVNPPVLSYNQPANCNYSVGYMKASPCGNKIATALYCTNSSEVALYDFNLSTGIVSNEMRISVGNPTGVYACEFSPDGTKLYVIPWILFGTTTIYQYDITLGSAAAITASKDSIGIINQAAVGDAQIGPDQKIYITKNNGDYLAVIDKPNLTGMNADLIDNAVYLGGRSSGIGLPSNIRGGICSNPQALFTAPNQICPGTCTDFTNLSVYATSFEWTFPGANPSTSTDPNPTQICYNSPGNYAVTLIATSAAGADTLTLNNYVTVFPSPPPQGISQSGDTLFALPGATSYQWYFNGSVINGATDYFYVAPTSGDYNVVATDGNGCEVEAVIFNVVAGLTPALSEGEGVTAYPNPVENQLTMHIPIAIGTQCTIGTAVEISIYNLMGEMVWKGMQESTENNQDVIVDVSELSSGMYWMEFISGEKLCRAKFIKSAH